MGKVGHGDWRRGRGGGRGGEGGGEGRGGEEGEREGGRGEAAPRDSPTLGALDGGPPMPPVDFRK